MLVLLSWNEVPEEIVSQHNLLTFLTLTMLVIVAAVLGVIIGMVRKINVAIARLTSLNDQLVTIGHNVNGPLAAMGVVGAAERHEIHAEQIRVRDEKVTDDAERREEAAGVRTEQVDEVRAEQDRVRTEKAEDDKDHQQ